MTPSTHIEGGAVETTPPMNEEEGIPCVAAPFSPVRLTPACSPAASQPQDALPNRVRGGSNPIDPGVMACFHQ